jgi:hypothetical protein
MSEHNEKLVDFEIFVFGSSQEFKIGVDSATLSSQVNTSANTQSYWVKEKIAAWDDPVPETKTTCIKWARTDIPPTKFCVGWKTELRNYRNEIWLTVSSPGYQDLKGAVERALSDAAVAAAIVAIASGGAAAIAAFKTVFISRITQEVKDAVVDVSNNGHWGPWR